MDLSEKYKRDPVRLLPIQGKVLIMDIKKFAAPQIRYLVVDSTKQWWLGRKKATKIEVRLAKLEVRSALNRFAYENS
jgi:hypothetical protein